jgi:broad specificity phosphatase PhoE
VLQNRDDALSPNGVEQVATACQLMQQEEIRLPTLVKYSLAASSIDTAMLVGQELKLGTDRLVPEFTFLDPRAIGDWDMSARNLTAPAVWAMDNDEAGRDGMLGRPPSSDDGTPHEVLADQAVRLRQVLSILESQYSGDTILLIFPDGTGPALLSAMIAGIPYNRVHELEYQPGEIRFDVTMESTLALWKSRQQSNAAFYQEVLREGRATLKELRETQRLGGTVANLKDQRIEEERIAIETEYREKERKRINAVLREKEQRMNRQHEIAAQRDEHGSDISSQIALGVASVAGASATAWRLGSSRELDEKLEVSTIDPGNELLASDGIPIIADNDLVSGLHVMSSDNKTDGVAAPILDPQEKARIAMEEYLNRDDGADDWILSLSQIIDESENDEIAAELPNSALLFRSDDESNVESIGQFNSLAEAELLSASNGDVPPLKVNGHDFVVSSDDEEVFQ